MTLLVQLFVDNLLPIFLVAGAGYALAASLKFEARTLSNIAFNLLLPCLTFRIVTQAQVPAGAVARMAGFAVASQLGLAILAFLVARLLRWSRPRTSAFVLCALVPNTGNFGMSANQIAFGQAGLTYASIYFIAASMVTATAGVAVASLGRAGLATALAGLVRVPAIWSVAVALLFRATGLSLPAPAHRALDLMADSCVPMLLLVLGIQLHSGRGGAPWRPVALATGMRLVGGASLALALAPLFGLAGPARQAGVFQASTPTAIITTVLAAEYDIEPQMVTATVFATTLLCPLTLTPLLALLR